MEDLKKTYEVEAGPFWKDISDYGSGYDVARRARLEGWRGVLYWGKDGYDLGSWPYMIFMFRSIESPTPYQLVTYSEGEARVYACPTREERDTLTDLLAFEDWKHQGCSWVEGYASVDEVPDSLKGHLRIDPVIAYVNGLLDGPDK